MDKHYGSWDGSRLRAETFRAAVLSFPKDTPLEITVRKAAKPKTTPQNRYLHTLFTIAAKTMNEEGYGDGNPWTKDKVKTYAKQAGLYPVEDRILPGGEVVQVALDTRELDKEDAQLTIDRVIGHFAELGIVLPMPGEQMQLA